MNIYLTNNLQECEICAKDYESPIQQSTADADEVVPQPHMLHPNSSYSNEFHILKGVNQACYKDRSVDVMDPDRSGYVMSNMDTKQKGPGSLFDESSCTHPSMLFSFSSATAMVSSEYNDGEGSVADEHSRSHSSPTSTDFFKDTGIGANLLNVKTSNLHALVPGSVPAVLSTSLTRGLALQVDSTPISPPARPYYLMSTHIQSNQPISTILNRINDILLSVSATSNRELIYEFDAEEYKWSLVHTGVDDSGSGYGGSVCKFNICIYVSDNELSNTCPKGPAAGDSQGFIIELHRLSVCVNVVFVSTFAHGVMFVFVIL